MTSVTNKIAITITPRVMEAKDQQSQPGLWEGGGLLIPANFAIRGIQ